MLSRSQVRALGQGSDDVVGARREFAEGRPMFGRCYQELVKSSLEVCREVYREFADRLSGARLEFAGRIPGSSSGVRPQVVGSSPRVHRRMLEVHWEFTEGNRVLAGGSSERCWEFAEETIEQRRLYAECRCRLIVEADVLNGGGIEKWT
ncbi:hypothetical protein BHM03_00037134 [Ensete ventricosum]|nr:hypothetical protein BHM03_00037134 [Ensete ventricosum]